MNRQSLLMLILIVLVGVFFRFYNLTDQGFISWDEGMYMNEVRFYDSVVENAPHIIHVLRGADVALQDVTEKIQGWPPSSAKPLHSFLIYLGSLVVGISDYSGQIMAAFFGVLSIIMLFILMKDMYGGRCALLSALLLACSGYHIYVSRLGVPETNSHFFLLLAWYFYWKSRSGARNNLRYVGLCGFALGCVLTTNYRWIIVLPLVWLFELVFLCMKRDRAGLKRLFVLSLSFFCIPVLCDMPYVPMYLNPSLRFGFGHTSGEAFSFLSQLVYYLGFQSGAGVFHVHDLYVRFLFGLNGVIVTSLAALGACLLIRRHRLQDFLIVCPVVIAFGLLSSKSRGNSLRYISVILPFMAALAAVAIDRLTSFVSPVKRRVVIVIVAVICSWLSLRPALQFVSMKSGYRQAMRYLVAHDGQRHLSTTNPHFEFFFGRNVAEQTPKTLEGFQEILAAGDYRYVVLDFMSHRVLHEETKQLIETACRPAAVFQNPIGDNYFTLIESLGYRHFIPGYIEKALSDPYGNLIVIYRVREVQDALDVYFSQKKSTA